MLGPKLGRAVFRIAFYVTVVSAVLLLFTERTSAEFVVAAITFVVGLTFTLLIAFLVRRTSK
ncbi:MAG: hypothetical protein ACP5HM_12655 [Anaerolineae bacterium]